MASITEHFIVGQDNAVTLTLLEDEVAITTIWTEIEVTFAGVTLTRSLTSPIVEDGITLESGVLTIVPNNLQTAEKTALLAVPTPNLYRVYVKIVSGSEPAGAVYGGSDSVNKLYFYVTDPV